MRWCLGQRRSDEPSFTTARRSKGLRSPLSKRRPPSWVPLLSRSRVSRTVRGRSGGPRVALGDPCRTHRVPAPEGSSFNRALEHASRPCIPADREILVFHDLGCARDRLRGRGAHPVELAKLDDGRLSRVARRSLGTANRSSGPCQSSPVSMCLARRIYRTSARSGSAEHTRRSVTDTRCHSSRRPGGGATRTRTRNLRNRAAPTPAKGRRNPAPGRLPLSVSSWVAPSWSTSSPATVEVNTACLR